MCVTYACNVFCISVMRVCLYVRMRACMYAMYVFTHVDVRNFNVRAYVVCVCNACMYALVSTNECHVCIYVCTLCMHGVCMCVRYVMYVCYCCTLGLLRMYVMRVCCRFLCNL